MDPKTQIWSLNKESWYIGPIFNREFAILHDHGCSISLDRNNLVFIGGHYVEKRFAYNAKVKIYYDYIPVTQPINDLVYGYNFLKDEWTKLQNVPNIQVSNKDRICLNLLLLIFQ